MFRMIRTYLIGGESGKREVALFLLFLWLGAAVYFSWQETNGLVLEETKALLMWTAVPIWGWLGLAFGFEWVSKQTTLLNKPGTGK